MGNGSNNKASKVILAQSGKMKRFKRQRISSAEGGGPSSLHNHYQLQKESNEGPYSVQIID